MKIRKFIGLWDKNRIGEKNGESPGNTLIGRPGNANVGGSKVLR